MPDSIDSYKPAFKKWSVSNTTQSVAPAASFTLSTTVGKGYRGGRWFVRGVVSPFGGTNGYISAEGSLRGSSSSSDNADSIFVGYYGSGYSTLVDSRLSDNVFNSVGGALYISNAYYQRSTGTVNIVFTNGSGASATLNARASGWVAA